MAPTLQNISLTAAADTDIWKKPPSKDIFTAPHTLERSESYPLNKLQSARITSNGQWTQRYDQAGVLLVLTEDGVPETSWIKAGLEYYNDVPHISFVGCDRFADWSVHPVHGDPNHATVELRREGDENGFALWAYEIVRDGTGKEVSRHPFRECTWLWNNEHQKQVKIGAYCARPASGPGLGSLEVKFDELDVVMRE